MKDLLNTYIEILFARVEIDERWNGSDCDITVNEIIALGNRLNEWPCNNRSDQ